MRVMTAISTLALGAALALGACSGSTPDQTAAPAATAPVTLSALEQAVASPTRGDNALRDNWRHPQETLEFLGLDERMSVIEIWPGGGWYADILVPYALATDGRYLAAGFETGNERFEAMNAQFLENYADAVAQGNVNLVPFGSSTQSLGAAGSADMVLSFRNVHNWMGAGFAEKAFADFYAALKPGGILGVVEHRLPATAEQDPRAPSGYVQEAYVKKLAAEAGFEFVASSEVNANLKDTADHPLGVWTLPPRNVRERPNNDIKIEDGSKYEAIGESDRMTLKFRKP